MNNGGILSGVRIAIELFEGRIRISNFKPEHVNPASYDLTLGRRVAQYDFLRIGTGVLDCKEELPTFEFEIPDQGYVLQPGVMYLMHTAERVWARDLVPVLDGKSSIGRLGICIHLTAGYGDPGFDGQYTLEVTSVYRVRVYPGMRFCQIRFHTMVGEGDYQAAGNYTDRHALGPVGSRAFKQFEKREPPV